MNIDDPRLAGFSIARFRFTLEALSAMPMPDYKGSIFRGSLGMALNRLFPPAYRELFRDGDGNDDPIRPYVLLPPLDNESSYPVEHTFECGLTLFGAAIRHALACFGAMDYLGNIGLGKARGRFRVLRIEVFRPEGWGECFNRNEGFSGHPTPFSARDFLERLPDMRPDSIELLLRTPLRLKSENRLLGTAPGFGVLMSRLIGRLNLLSMAIQNTPLLNHEQKHSLLALAEKIETVESDWHWEDWSRYSARQREWMKFGGLLGRLAYRGELAPFFPYLKLAEIVHMGGRTPFGLGYVQVVPGNI
ncbi:MAG: CRISPR system precrRNA processing endoribonuclease RAMP protein Cas6 [Sulfuricellaceae bacterium]